MRTFPVIQDKIGFQVFEGITPIPVVLEVDPFIFYRSPKAFDKNIILEAATSIHADFDLGIF